MRQDITESSAHDCTLQFNCVEKRQEVGDFLKNTADELKIEPYPRKPCREICQQRAADPADLLGIEDAPEEQTERDIEKAYGKDKQDRIKDIDCDIEPEDDRCYIADDALQDGNRQDRQSIPEDEIKRCRSALSRSFAMSAAVKRVIKERPNTVIPGAR